MKKLYQQPSMQIKALTQDVVRTSGVDVVKPYTYDWFFGFENGGDENES